MEGMIGGIVGLVGAGLQAQAQANQVEYEYAALNWQKERAVQQDWFAQAGRQDMYGNKTYYDPASNTWKVTLAPMQQDISQAQQKEQLLELTKDAPAARKIKEQVQARAAEAAPLYHQALQGYMYDQPPSEESIRSELMGLMANNDMLRSKADQALIMRASLRMGQGARAPDIIQATDQQLGDAQTIQNRMLQARQQALQEYGARLQQHEAQWGTPLKFYADIMQQGGDLPNMPRSATDQQLSASIGQQMSGMNNAFNQGTSNVSSAMQALAQSIGKSPDFSAAASAFGKIGKNKDGTSTGSDNTTYDPTQINNMGWSSYGGFAPSEGSLDNRGDSGWD